MLKVKDNVDLKELEKFGFIRGQNGYFTHSGNNRIRIHYSPIEIHHKKIWIDEWISAIDYYGTLDLLFDLINAGLVEKV